MHFLHCAEEQDPGQQETPVDDPIGLGERLALIDFLRDEKKMTIPQGASLEDLRRMYWKSEKKVDLDANALMRDRISRLRHQLEGKYAMSIDKNISWNDLLKLRDTKKSEKEKSYQAMLKQQLKSKTTEEASIEKITDIKKLKHAVVLVATSSSTGTGFFIHHRGYLITNRHVVGKDSLGGYATIHWDTSMKRDPENFDIIAISQKRDLALLKPKTLGKSYPVLQISKNHEIGVAVLAAGFPLGAAVGQTLGTNNFDLTITKGSISSIKRKGEKVWFLQNDCAIGQGCSGGPLLNSNNNRVLGITTSVIDPSKTGNVGAIMAFAIPAAEIRAEFHAVLP
ncbi:MAG: trypsin-like peptidase domain-containing protein [Planctomycetes bacterium]|nr:trypsin-like peptidase domain-containing protein [Planctomycetota bacterium]